MGIIEQYDLVLDCTDNATTRYLINDCCVLLGKVLVSGAALRTEGQVSHLGCHIVSHLENHLDFVFYNSDHFQDIK